MKAKPNGIEGLIKSLKTPVKPPPAKLGISPGDTLKARVAYKLGGTIGEIAKALNVSYPTAWKAVKGVKPYDAVK